MEKIRIKKEDLRKILINNRDVHAKGFLKATEDYWVAFEGLLKDKLEDVKSKKKNTSAYVNLSAPEDHTDDYDRALRMIDHSADDLIEFSSESYDKYVEDNWNWKSNWFKNSRSLANTSLGYK